MFTYFIEADIKNSRIFITAINSAGQIITGLGAQFENAVVKENSINERIYIVDSKEQQTEYLSLPIDNVVIKTIYDAK